ncbi:cytochrome c-type biogenesis protein CcmH [Bacillus sp. B-jedd]|uniref:cytochrome c-type biogenesis protein CcmH n=1 Tax=Bacillus sp. B-jedd TaxID=1476857 RepID=UPI000515706A|nr:cytochrome c-type biogenesis protein CcmH [Bacillus sp. B-jedd]CEG28268.1 Cytochrome C biogenesis protein [Bacillus sp. B-jedd]
MRKTVLLLMLFLSLLPAVAFASFTANSPEFKAVADQLYMDGHAEHDITTCKVRKLYTSEVLEMLEEGLGPDEIISHYTDVLGPSALKAPDKGGSGLFAWLMPAVAAAAGGVIAVVAIRKITAAKKPAAMGNERQAMQPDMDNSSFEEVFETERKKHF